MIKYLKYIFISFLCILLMSHNTSALELNVDVQTLWGNYVPNPVEFVLAQPNNYGSGLFVCYNSAGGNWNRVRGVNFSLPSGYTPRSGDIIEFSFNATSSNNQNVNIAFGAQATSNGWDVVSWDFENATNSSGALKVILVAGSSATRNISLMRPEGWTIFDLNENECVGISNIGIYRPKGDSSQAIVDAINNSSDSAAINSAKDAIVNAINQQKQAEENYYNEQEEAVDNINNQDPDDIDTGDSSSATSLLGAMGSLFTTIKDTAATNCLITGDLGHVNMGQLNLCQGKEHFQSLFNFIGYSCLFVVVFWASYSLVKRILRLIDWYRSK